MRKTGIVVSLVIATALGVAVAYRSGSSPSASPTALPAHERVRTAETGAIYKLHEAVPARDKDEKKLQQAPALSLTASDGTGLKLASLEAKGVVQGQLAFTELRLAFDNPDDRTLEGTFRIVLPQGAAISRFAMRIGDRWQEGEVVEKQAARQAYEDFLHRKQDPALLEQAAGNEFSARVFPIPARGRKELIVSYSQELSPEAPYMVPLKGLPEVGKLDLVVTRSGDDAPILGQLHSEQKAPEGDFLIDPAKVVQGDGLRSGGIALVRVRPAAEAGADAIGSALVLVDTSASRALGFEAQVALVEQLAAQLAAQGTRQLVVAAFDQGIDIAYEGAASGFAAEGGARLRERQAFGASDLESALSWAKEQASKRKLSRVIVVSDGVPTLGATEGAQLKEAAARLKGAGVERLDVVAVGGIRDDSLLKSLTTAGLARDGVVVEGAKGAGVVTRKLNAATRSNIAVKVEGATWQWPEKLDGVQPGDEVLVYAEVPPANGIKVTVGGASFSPMLTAVDAQLLERAWAQAKIASLVQKPPAELSEAGVKEQVVGLSTRYRVLSPYTSLLVLETEADYARFKIDRKALADILTIDDTKIARLKRSEDSLGGKEALPSREATNGAKPEIALKPPPTPATVQNAPPPPPMDRSREAKGKRDSAQADDIPGQGAARGPAKAAAAAPMAEAPMAMATATAAPTAPAPMASSPPSPDPSPAPASPPAMAPGGQARAAPARPAAAGAAPGNMWGDESGDSFGRGGLGLSGIGEGGGGRSEGIGLGSIGTLGHGSGTGSGQGFGSGRGITAGDHKTRAPQVRAGAVTVNGRLPPEVVQRIVRQNFGRFRLCYENGLRENPNLAGRVSVRFVIGRDGAVSSAGNGGSEMPDQKVQACVIRSFSALSFPQPEGGVVTVTYPITFSPGDGSALPAPTPAVPAAPPAPVKPPELQFGPYAGKMAEVMSALAKGDKPGALSLAVAFRNQSPGDVMALVAVGEAFEAMGETRSAARAYGSIIDLFSSRADLRRMAGERLERLGNASSLSIAADSFAKAAAQRPDHPASHRLLAYARLRQGDYEGAFSAIEAGAKRTYPSGRFLGVDRILKEDMGLIGAAWGKAEWSKKSDIARRLSEAGASLEEGPSVRFVLNWETDANDVDFHIHDGKGGHAYYSQKTLPSGGELYADVTTGYGPECFTVRQASDSRSGPYRLQAHYYSRGPMGYGMGKLEIIDHDGHGNLTFEERPFVVMQDRAFVEMGTYPASKPE